MSDSVQQFEADVRKLELMQEKPMESLEAMAARYSLVELSRHEIVLYLDRLLDLCDVVLPLLPDYDVTRKLIDWMTDGRSFRQQTELDPPHVWPASEGQRAATIPSVTCPHCGEQTVSFHSIVPLGCSPEIKCWRCRRGFRLKTRTTFIVEKLECDQKIVKACESLNLDFPYKCGFYPSGTINVELSSIRGPWLSIHHRSDTVRQQKALEIRDFLNGHSPMPRWLTYLHRQSAEVLKSPEGMLCITVCGPMVDVNPPHLDWRTEMTSEAIMTRVHLLDRVDARKLAKEVAKHEICPDDGSRG